MLRLLVCFGLIALPQAQSAPQVLPAIEGPSQSDFAPGVPRQGTPGVTPPRLIKSVDPTYSNDAMRLGVQGTVILDAIVGADGAIEESRVRCSLHPSLDAQAVQAFRAWSFQPARLNGVPARFVVEVQMEFRLHDEREPPALTAIPGLTSGSRSRRTGPCTPPK